MSANQAGRRFLADIQRLLSTLLYRDVADPRLANLTITRVESSGRQLVTVWVYRSFAADEAGDIPAVLQSLQRMTPHFEHELRRALPRRRLPSLRFCWDENFEKSGDVLQMLRELERP